jgi:hypothetical protein
MVSKIGQFILSEEFREGAAAAVQEAIDKTEASGRRAAYRPAPAEADTGETVRLGNTKARTDNAG